MNWAKIGKLARPQYKSEHITNVQSAKDILKQLRRAEYNSRDFSQKLKPFFQKPDKLATCELVFKFLKAYFIYVREPKSNQTAKELPRYINDRFGDCKHYATCAVGILNACNIPAWFVLVSQDRNSKSPTHAYAAALVNNQIVILDPCRKNFNSECTHYYKYNVPPIKK